MIRPAGSLAALVPAMALAACAAGPDFHAPAPPAQQAYTPQPITTAGEQRLSPAPVDARWWTLFGSPELNALVDQALAANTDLAATRAALKAARESWLASRGALLPTVDASAGTSRNKGTAYLAPALSNNSFDYNLQTAQVTVGYTLDLFGGIRRQVESARAQYLAQRYQAEAARISLITNVVAAAFQQASLRDQVAAQARVVALAEQQATITRRQLADGQIAGTDVMAQQAALAQARLALSPLRKALAQADDQLAYLTGRSPADPALPGVDLARVTLPHALPLSLPAELVRQRPDVRAAEENLHAASAQLGVAIAARLPQITLVASGGGSAANWANLLGPANTFWTLGAGISQPVFAGGALLHRQRGAQAQLDQARAVYRSAVLTAFQNVADTLHALREDADALAAAEAARHSAEASYAVAQRQHDMGEASLVAVIITEQALHAARQTATQAQAQRLSDTAALYQALGGGWWNQPA